MGFIKYLATLEICWYVEIKVQLQKELNLIVAHRARPEKFAKLKLQFSLFVRGELRMGDKQQDTSRPFWLDDMPFIVPFNNEFKNVYLICMFIVVFEKLSE